MIFYLLKQLLDVSFRYPDQPPEHGLQKISFFLPAGSTTGIAFLTFSPQTNCSNCGADRKWQDFNIKIVVPVL